MRQDHGWQAKFNFDGDKKQQQADADQDFRHHQRHIHQTIMHILQFALVAMQGNGRGRSQQGGNQGGKKCHQQGVDQGVPDFTGGKKLGIPFQRKAAPVPASSGGIE